MLVMLIFSRFLEVSHTSANEIEHQASAISDSPGKGREDSPGKGRFYLGIMHADLAL